MTNPQPSAAAERANHSTGPKTPEGKRRCRLNACRHNLTGQLIVFTPEEQQAHEKHSKIVLEALAPVGAFERSIAQSIADGHWRLQRAGAIEAATFALGMQENAKDNTGVEPVDDAFAHARTWRQDGLNLHLLTIYEQRIQRAVEKNVAHLKAVQAERKAEAKDSMDKAKLLYKLAQAEGKPYQPEKYFTFAPSRRESVFSTPEVTLELSRTKLLDDAKNYHYNGSLPRTQPRTPRVNAGNPEIPTPAATSRDQASPATSSPI